MTVPRSLLIALAVLLGACSLPSLGGSSEEPWSSSLRGRAMQERSMSRGRARDVLGALDPGQRAVLDELMFLADLQMASGNEFDPLRIHRRVLRELAEPRTVPPATVALVLDDMGRVMEAHPGVPEREHDTQGYEVVTRMLASAQGALPSAGESLERVAAMPEEVAVAFLVQEYFADDHYHEYWMRQRIFDILVSGGYGPLPLPVIEARLRASWPSHSPDSDWARCVAAGRAIVGPDFEAWYREQRGRSYRWEWLLASF
jgi:hypothetical protein